MGQIMKDGVITKHIIATITEYIRFQTIRSIRYSVFYCIIKYTFAVFIYWLWLNEPHFAFCVCSVIASIHSFVSIYYSIWKCFQMNNSSYRAFNWMRRLTADAGPLMHQICHQTQQGLFTATVWQAAGETKNSRDVPHAELACIAQIISHY